MRTGLTKPQATAIESATTEEAKVRAAAEVMVERPLDLIKHILMKHEQAVIEVMREQQQRIKELEGALDDVLFHIEDAMRNEVQPYEVEKAAWRSRAAWRTSMNRDVDENFHPVEQKAVMLSDEEIIHAVPGMLDCLSDPYDAAKNGDYYSSIPLDMVRLGRAIESKVRQQDEALLRQCLEALQNCANGEDDVVLTRETLDALKERLGEA